MEALDVIRKRRSIRRYKSEQVNKEDIVKILEAGMYAPSAMGTQSPYFVVVQDKEDRDTVARLNAQVWGRENFDPYYGAPTIILVFATNKAMSDFTKVIDASAATTNMLNAAYSLGLGSCWIHRTKEVFELEEGKELLRKWGIEEDLEGVASIALGYPDMDLPEAKPRKEDYYKII